MANDKDVLLLASLAIGGMVVLAMRPSTPQAPIGGGSSGGTTSGAGTSGGATSSTPPVHIGMADVSTVLLTDKGIPAAGIMWTLTPTSGDPTGFRTVQGATDYAGGIYLGSVHAGDWTLTITPPPSSYAAPAPIRFTVVDGRDVTLHVPPLVTPPSDVGTTAILTGLILPLTQGSAAGARVQAFVEGYAGIPLSTWYTAYADANGRYVLHVRPLTDFDPAGRDRYLVYAAPASFPSNPQLIPNVQPQHVDSVAAGQTVELAPFHV
jgi:hypothetical protein